MGKKNPHKTWSLNVDESFLTVASCFSWHQDVSHDIYMFHMTTRCFTCYQNVSHDTDMFHMKQTCFTWYQNVSHDTKMFHMIQTCFTWHWHISQYTRTFHMIPRCSKYTNISSTCMIIISYYICTLYSIYKSMLRFLLIYLLLLYLILENYSIIIWIKSRL